MQRQRIALIFWLVLLLLGVVTGATAQESSSYNLEWHVVGGGGGESRSTSYVVNGTIGQGAAGPPLLSSTHYLLGSGYWYGAGTAWRIYLPLIMRGG